MRIAICNADNEYSKFLKDTIYAYAAYCKLDIYVECFKNGSKMLETGNYYSLILLSDKLIGENGFTVAERVRKELPISDIIFEGEKTEDFIEAFKINPYRFLVSPITKVKLISVLEEYFEIRGNDYNFSVKSGLDTYYVNTSEILYVEADNKHCNLQLDNKRLHCNKTMGKIYNILPKNHFIKIHRAFVVNGNYINHYNRDSVYLKNGETLHISRHYYREFKEEYQRLINPVIP